MMPIGSPNSSSNGIILGGGGGGGGKGVLRHYSRSSRARLNRDGGPDDRLSALPDSLLLHILSFIPMEDAIKTHVLSKRWRFLWTCTHNLDFTRRRYREPDQLVAYVNRSLILCASSKRKKFCVKLEYRQPHSSDVDLWTIFVVRNEVEELVLDLYNQNDGFDEYDSYMLPRHLCEYSLLTSLKLSQFEFVPNRVVNWKALRNLSIGYLQLSEDVIQMILSGSPVLEFLELHCFWFVGRLHISSATVRKLVIRQFMGPYESSGYSSDEDENEDENTFLNISGPNLRCLQVLRGLQKVKCRLMNVPSLVEASLDFDLTTNMRSDNGDGLEEHRNILRQLLHSLLHVQSLTIGNWCLEVLQTFNTKLPSSLSKLKCLTLDTCVDNYNLYGIASLLESSPYLETLIIKMSSHGGLQLEARSYFDLAHFCDGTTYWTSETMTFKCLLQHLKIIKIVNFVEGDCISQFLKFLLQRALVLERMIINAPEEGNSSLEELFQSAQALLSFPRASSRAVILFSD